MSLKSSANMSVNTHELILEISAEDFNKAVLNAYKKEKNQIQIKQGSYVCNRKVLR